MERCTLRPWALRQWSELDIGMPRSAGSPMVEASRSQCGRLFCRSELAREELTDAAFIQETRVIVEVFREQELGVPLAPTGGYVRLTDRH